MGEIIVKNMNELKLETNHDDSSLLEVLQANYIDWMHACGGKGRCTTCKFRIISGTDALSSITPSEERFFHLNQLKKNERLACQAKPQAGVIHIEAPDEYKLPHVDYSY